MVIYNKLVRDRIPEIIEADGRRCEVRVLDQNEYVERLNQKLEEELQEYRKSHDVAELVDLLEVIYAIASHHGMDRDEVEHVRMAKRTQRGGFDRRLLLTWVAD